MTSRLVRSRIARGKSLGFSLLELMIVIAIGLTMAGVTFMALMPLMKQNHVDQAYDMTLSVLRTFRNQAITSSGRYIISFPTNQTIQVQFWGYASPVSSAPTAVSSYTLPPDMQFAVQAGLPTAAPDFPGLNGTTAIQFNACTITESGNPCVIFNPDGSAQDDAGTPGNYNNGVLYITRPTSNVYSSRAITIWGATGRIRGWRLYSQGGVNTWVQQ
jgi:prepilin-type N-terminal cleavage/methylation domain-containing protein